MKRAVALRHIAFEDLGTLGPVLEAEGYEVSYLESPVDDLSTVVSSPPDLLVVLGGPIGAYDERDYPFVLDEIDLIEHRLGRELPTLGICLGAQMMARALGARVYPGGRKEIGWAPLRLTEVGRASPMAHLAPEMTPVLHWHGDTFDLPDRAALLASSDLYENQAFAYDGFGLALQFHPEVTVRGMEKWFVGHTGEIAATPAISVGQLRDDTARWGPGLERQGADFFRDWLRALG